MTDLLPVDEMSDRLDLIEVIRNNLIILTPGRPLDHIQFSYLIGMSLKDLRMFLNITGPATVLQTINGLGKLTAHCKYNNTFVASFHILIYSSLQQASTILYPISQSSSHHSFPDHSQPSFKRFWLALWTAGNPSTSPCTPT